MTAPIDRRKYIFLLFLCVASSLHLTDAEYHNVTLSFDTWTQLHMNSTYSNYSLIVSNIHPNVTFLIVQAHSFRNPVTLATAKRPLFGQYVTSEDAGMTTLLSPDQTEVTYYLSSTTDKNSTVYVLVTPFDEFDPIPGGCNQEFPLKHDPNIHLSHDPNIGSMAYQFSNRGFPRLRNPDDEPDCESMWDVLTYEVYIHYMSSTNPSAREHFLAMQHMTHPDDIVKYGRKMVTVHRGKGLRPRSEFMAYPGQGIIYNVIVTERQGHMVRRSAYIPSTSYSCNLIPDHPNSCDTLDDRSHPYKAIATTMALGGVMLMLFGHRFFKCNMFSFGFLSFTLLSYICLRLTLAIDPMDVFWISLALGVVGGVIWLAFWWFVGIPVLSILLVGLTGGYLMASLVFYTPFDSFEIFRQEFNYGMIFTCWVLFSNVLLLPWAKKLSIVSSSLIGSYSIVFATGLYIKSSVPYILINSVRKAVIPKFILAIPTKPYFTVDTILLITWVVVFLVACAVQFYTTRHDADFPPCPRAERRSDLQRLLVAEESANDVDRQGLLSQVSYPNYNTIAADADTRSGGVVNPGYGSVSPGRGYMNRRVHPTVSENEIA